MPRRLQVQCRNNGLPRSFCWRGKTYAVAAIVERWKDTGYWWQGEAAKLFYRVRTGEGGLWEIYWDTAEQAWFLYRVYD